MRSEIRRGKSERDQKIKEGACGVDYSGAAVPNGRPPPTLVGEEYVGTEQRVPRVVREKRERAAFLREERECNCKK